ncbi:cysteine-rich DPF motif domain-containing protein 1 isoform X1 [Malaclemys terrapin pileata]|uniref:cysteine-rich DPF motif domain-containing protein 1 isoform X1 n=1 Tax=Malaclemys terrapin pileata TaxID=2991368 RepID=UPI0023A861A9|nr:cysteine-rich DPF motif domain-containing protein 1 isoform X1 [Malaclemys terrapin pileata]
MDSRKEAQPKGDFECQLCGLTAPYSYYGQKPPNTHSVVLLEESYVMKDPFVPDKDKFLILGSQCSLCNRRVCVGTVESLQGDVVGYTEFPEAEGFQSEGRGPRPALPVDVKLRSNVVRPCCQREILHHRLRLRGVSRQQ